MTGLSFPLPARRRLAGVPGGALRSRSRGSGLDLAGARAYQPGDDVRRIDWRLSARLSSASDGDELVVREHFTEESTRLVVAVDRSPSMELYPPELPWLQKPLAVDVARDMIEESAIRAGCRVQAFEEAADAIPALLGGERPVPAGAFVFVLSDFLGGFAQRWEEPLERELDVVPVVLQDPVWERSFPEVAGAMLPLLDQGSGRLFEVSLSRAEVRSRRERNEARLAALLGRFASLGLDWVTVSSHDAGAIYAAFLDWAQGRQQGARLAR